MKIALQVSHETSHGFLYTDKDTDAHIFHYTSTHVSMHAYKQSFLIHSNATCYLNNFIEELQ